MKDTCDCGAERPTLHRWGTKTAGHRFRPVCGILTHHGRRSNLDECGVNAAILEGASVREPGEIGWVDGTNHPSDRVRRGRPGPWRVPGPRRVGQRKHRPGPRNAPTLRIPPGSTSAQRQTAAFGLGRVERLHRGTEETRLLSSR